MKIFISKIAFFARLIKLSFQKVLTFQYNMKPISPRTQPVCQGKFFEITTTF